MIRWWHVAPMVASLGSGCITLDSFVFNAVHCSTVSDATCSSEGVVWDQVCTTCDEDYPWDREYPWMAETLDDGESIRGIDPSTVQDHDFETTDGEGTIDAYFIPAHGDDEVLAGITLVYNHGNYAGIEHYLPRIQMLHEAGFSIFVWDYRGYGKSQPEWTPSPEQFLADARQAGEVAAGLAADPTRMVVYANSLGTIPAIEMAVAGAPCALILEAPFVSMEAVALGATTLTMGDNFLSEGLFDNAERIRDYDGPLLAMLGSEDNKFTVEQVQELVDNAPGTKEFWVLDGVKHGIANIGVPEAGFSEYVGKMRSFLETSAPTCLTSSVESAGE